MNFEHFKLMDWLADPENHKYVKYNLAISGMQGVTWAQTGIDINQLPLYMGYLDQGSSPLVNKLSRIYEVKPNQVLITSSATVANLTTFMGLLEPGDHVIVEAPSYQSLIDIPRALGVQVSLVERRADNDFHVEIDEIKKLIKPHKTRLLVLTNLHNPSNAKLGKHTLNEISYLAQEHELYFLVDEVFLLSAWDKDIPPAGTLPRGITTNSLTKFFGMTACKCGWLIGPEEVVERLIPVKQHIFSSASSIGETVTHKVWGLMDKAKEVYDAKCKPNLQAIRDFAGNNERVTLVPPQDGIVCFPKFDIPMTTYDFARRLASKYETLVAPGECFGLGGHARLCLSVPPETFTSGLEAIERALTELEDGV